MPIIIIIQIIIIYKGKRTTITLKILFNPSQCSCESQITNRELLGGLSSE